MVDAVAEWREALLQEQSDRIRGAAAKRRWTVLPGGELLAGGEGGRTLRVDPVINARPAVAALAEEQRGVLLELVLWRRAALAAGSAEAVSRAEAGFAAAERRATALYEASEAAGRCLAREQAAASDVASEAAARAEALREAEAAAAAAGPVALRAAMDAAAEAGREATALARRRALLVRDEGGEFAKALAAAAALRPREEQSGGAPGARDPGQAVLRALLRAPPQTSTSADPDARRAALRSPVPRDIKPAFKPGQFKAHPWPFYHDGVYPVAWPERTGAEPPPLEPPSVREERKIALRLSEARKAQEEELRRLVQGRNPQGQGQGQGQGRNPRQNPLAALLRLRGGGPPTPSFLLPRDAQP